MIPAWVTVAVPFRKGIPGFTQVARNFRRKSRLASRSPLLAAASIRAHMKVAVVGCAHGEVEAIYTAVREIERAQSTKVDLILCAGDFQAVRNLTDLACMACPDKFRHMHTFWKYHSGALVAPIPTIFIGGNHEASNHLQEIPLGGLVAPNMYFLGNAGVIKYRGLRIAGVSGVYTDHNYEKPRNETPPYPKNQIKSVYHARRTDVDRLLRIRRPVDIFLSHDWPRGIWHHGDCDALLNAKPFLKSEIKNNTLGNPGTAAILEQLQPRYWFSAHMHVKFPAVVKHSATGNETRFLALDKVLPRREFIQLLEIPIESSPMSSRGSHQDTDNSVLDNQLIEIDSEWLTILRSEGAQSNRRTPVTEEEINETSALMTTQHVSTTLNLRTDFLKHAEDYDTTKRGFRERPEKLVLQPRTEQLSKALNLLCVDDRPGNAFAEKTTSSTAGAPLSSDQDKEIA